MQSRVLLAALLFVAANSVSAAEPDLALTGTITGADHKRFVARQFDVPAGVRAVTVDFSYDRTVGTVIDIGLFDEARFRGWSGGNKASFVVSDTEATPSYLSGPVARRKFSLLLGVPNARAGSSAAWRAEVRFERGGSRAVAPLKSGPGWYRGDLHSHSGHSDGTCANDAGTRVPCPLYRSVEAAARAGLDFFALTEHNTVSHLTELLALQPAYSRLLLIPGQEMTTFFGHANALGTTALAEFRVGTPEIPDGAAWARANAGLGGIVSVNHPGLPSGEACMGCGWTMRNTDWSTVQAIEIVNGGAVAIAGGAVETPLSGIPFWEARLTEGHRMAPIAGSDNHDATLLPPDARAIGTLTTNVWADELSVAGIMTGIRRGRVFVDVGGVQGRLLDLAAETPTGPVTMGGTLPIIAGREVRLTARVAGCAGCSTELVHDGRRLPPVIVPSEDAMLTLTLVPAGRGWVRADVRDPKGKLLLVGNAIHLVAR